MGRRFVPPPRTPVADLCELVGFIERELEFCQYPPRYNKTQQAIAYKRVLSRLRPIVSRAIRTAEALNFVVSIQGEKR